jgi:hypothetical protein
MEALDGNAIGGQLFDYFGTEMTTAKGDCGHCGTRAQIAELLVYAHAPGAVVRCRACGQVVMVIVEVRGAVRVNLDWFKLLESPAT